MNKSLINYQKKRKAESSIKYNKMILILISLIMIYINYKKKNRYFSINNKKIIGINC